MTADSVIASEAKQSRLPAPAVESVSVDFFVAALLAMTVKPLSRMTTA
jgi:hypothetical protein